LHLIELVKGFQVPGTRELFLEDHPTTLSGERLVTDFWDYLGEKFPFLFVS
jgi:hypothetical protein